MQVRNKVAVGNVSEGIGNGCEGPWVSINGDSTRVSVTVSPGCQPEPVIVTVVPGG